MHETTKIQVLAWEATTIDMETTLQLVATLMKTNNLWVLKGAAGQMACIEMMREIADGTN